MSTENKNMFKKNSKEEGAEAVVEKRRGPVGQVYSALTLRNSVKSVITSTVEGADVVKSAASNVLDGYVSRIAVDRSESFDEACNRLGIDESRVSLIHNQLMLQAYVSLAVGVAALIFAINAFFSGSLLLVKLAALGAAAASFGNAIQASVQCFRVRVRSLVEFSSWLESPENWLPRKIGTNSELVSGDSRLDRKMLAKTISRSRRFFFIAILILLLSMPGFFFDNLVVSNLQFTTTGIGLLFMVIAVRSSITAMQATKKMEVDFLSWLASPEFWLPELDDSMKQKP